jgi:hypothetical protein
MPLVGTREDWEALTYDYEEVWDLKESHRECIRRALSAAPPDASLIEVDAAPIALRQAFERSGGRQDTILWVIGARVADADECWWMTRARMLGLSSIRPAHPWPRCASSAEDCDLDWAQPIVPRPRRI